MGTVTQCLDVSGARPDVTNTPELVYISGTNFPPTGYAFPQNTARAIYLQFRSLQYGGGNLTLQLTWYSRSGSTTGSVTWSAALAAISPGDAQSVETKAFATAQTTTTSVNATARGDTLSTITISNLDGLVNNDDCWIKILRTDVSMVGDAVLIGADVSYSDGLTGTPGTGDYVGPASSTTNALVRYADTTGKLGKNSPVTCDDSGNLAGVGTVNGGVVAISTGFASGDKPEWNGSTFAPKTGLFVEMSASANVTLTTLADITGLSVSIPRAGTYRFRAALHSVQSSATSSTFSLSVNFSGTVTRIMYGALLPNSATAVASLATTTNNGQLTSGARTVTTAFYNLIDGTLVCSTSGTLSVRAARSATNTTIGAGSNFNVVEI